jgi:hypothetical protein
VPGMHILPDSVITPAISARQAVNRHTARTRAVTHSAPWIRFVAWVVGSGAASRSDSPAAISESLQGYEAD